MTRPRALARRQFSPRFSPQAKSARRLPAATTMKRLSSRSTRFTGPWCGPRRASPELSSRSSLEAAAARPPESRSARGIPANPTSNGCAGGARSAEHACCVPPPGRGPCQPRTSSKNKKGATRPPSRNGGVWRAVTCPYHPYRPCHPFRPFRPYRPCHPFRPYLPCHPCRVRACHRREASGAPSRVFRRRRPRSRS